MPTKTCNTCNLTLDISNFGKTGKWYRKKCKQCTYNSIKCKHGKRKDRCCEGDCNGIGMCKHGIRQMRCKKCEGSQICEHKNIKNRCKECGGSDYCEHGKLKRYCKECDGSAFCKHGKRRTRCKECGGSIYCKHEKQKIYCKECDGSAYCEHEKLKKYCKECGGSQICEHDKRKDRCHKCGGTSLCIHCEHILINKKRYVESLDKKVRCCARCFYHFYPNDKIPRRYKMRQNYFNEKLIEEFGDIFEYDKQIKCGCSKRRPDWFIDCYKYSIIIELDEDQHKYTSCDEKRMMELFQDLGNRQLVLIRINPDKYNKKGKMKEGCFEFDEKNTIKCLTKEFDRRFNKLVNFIDYYLDNEPEKEITVRKLFFDKI